MQFAESSEFSTRSNTNSASPEKCNSDEGDDQRGSSQSTTPNSSLEANGATDIPSLSTFKEASIKLSEGTSRSSYAMDDILRINSQSSSTQGGVNGAISETRKVESGRKHSETEKEIMRIEISKLLNNTENLKENSDIKEIPTGESNKTSNEEKWNRCVQQTNPVISPSPFFLPMPRDMFGLFCHPRGLVDSVESLLLKPLPNNYPHLNNANEKFKQPPLTFLPPNLGIPVETTTNNQTEALSLVVDKDNNNHSSLLESNQGFENPMLSPRKKRTKVTDTRLPPQKMPSSNGIPLPTLEDSSPPKSIFGCPFNPSQKTLNLPSNVVDRPNFFHRTLPTSNHFLSLFQPNPFLGGNSQFHLPHAICRETSPIPTPSSSGLSEPGPIRRNRSIGSRRVTNTASMLNYGGDARPYRIPTSITDDGTARLHSSISTHPLPMVLSNFLEEEGKGWGGEEESVYENSEHSDYADVAK
nr:homeobox protein prospero:prox 1 [Hymenolepis microstoma]